MNKKSISTFMMVLSLLGMGLSRCEAQQKQTDPQETEKQSVLFPFRSSSDGLIGYINEKGFVVVIPQFAYKDHSTFSNRTYDGRAIVMKKLDSNDELGRPKPLFKYGYIDDRGKIAVELKYDEAKQFSEGLAAVRIDKTWGYIDRTGRIAINFSFDAASEFRDGLARVCSDQIFGVSQFRGGCGFIDKAGKVMIRPNGFTVFSDFSEGLAVAEVGDNKFGYIDKLGKMVIPPKFRYADSFSEGLAAVWLNEDFSGYIDKNGQMVIKGVHGGNFSGGRAIIKKEIRESSISYPPKYGYIDREGRIIIKEQFSEAEEFSEGFAPIRSDDGKFRYIDEHGRTIIESFHDAERFHDGLALVITDKKTEILIKDKADLHLKDKADVGLDSIYHSHITYYKYAYIDRRGKIVFRWIMPLVTGPVAGASGPQPGTDPSPVKVKVSSTPSDARVYFIPLDFWEEDEKIIDDDERLFQYWRGKNSGTKNAPSEFEVNPQVYIVVVKLNGKKDKRRLDVNSFGTNEVEFTFPQ